MENSVMIHVRDKKICLIILGISSIILLSALTSWAMIASSISESSLFDSQDSAFHLSFGPSLQIERGDMTYSIQGPEDGGWKSQLEWDLDNLLYVGGVISARFRGTYEFNTGLWKSVSGGDGTMKDDDWFYAVYGNTPVVQSESDTESDGLHFDVNMRYRFTLRKGMTLSPIIGYAYTKWDWETQEGYQTAVDPFSFYVGPLPAGGVTYTEELYVPYIGLAFSGVTESAALGFQLYGLYSPIAQCDDEDDHKLRGKIINGETDGTFLSLGGDVRWKLSQSWSVTGNLNYTSYDLSGEQRQYFYAGTNPPIGTLFTGIDLDIEGSQTYFGLMASYEF